MPNRSSIKIPLHWVLVIPFVVQVMGAVGLVGWLSYRSGQQAVENLANKLTYEVSARVSDRITWHLHHSQEVVAANHLAVHQGSLNVQNFEQLRQHLWQQMVLHPSLGSSGFWSEQGRAISYGRILSEEEQNFARKVTGKNLKLGTLYLSQSAQGQRKFYLVNERGVPRQPIYEIPDDFRNLPWYRYARTVTQQSWTPVLVNRVMPVLNTIAVAPIEGKDGQFQGVFSSVNFLIEINTFLRQLNFSPSGQIFIVERSGALVATSASEVPQVSTGDGQISRLSALDSQDVRTREITQQLQTRFGNFLNLQEKKQLSLTTNQQKQFVQITPFQDDYGLDWLIVTVVPESDFMGEINTNLWRTIFLSALTLLGTTATGILTAYFIARPIQRLSQASQALAAGDWQQSLKEDSQIRELSDLARSFNLTAEHLQQSFNHIKSALHESEVRFTKVFLTSPDPISITTTVEGRYLDVNDSFLKFSEYSREEVIGQTVTSLNLSVDPEQTRTLQEQLKRHGRVEAFEYHYCTKNGRLGTTLLSIERVELDGQPRYITISKDISDRKQAEAALRQNEEQFQQLATASPGVIYTVVESADGPIRYEYLSPAFAEIHEVPVEVAMQDASITIHQIHPDDRVAYQQAVARSLELMQPFRHEWRIITPSGKTKWIQASSRPQRREQGEIVWHGVVLDITERKVTERALQQAVQQLSTHFDNSPLAIMEWDKDFKVLRWSKQAERLFGWKAEELNTTSWKEFQFVYEADRERVNLEISDLLKGHVTSKTIQNRNYTKDGRVITCQWYSSAVFDESGHLVAVLSFAEDITDRQQAELELRQQKDLRETIYNESTDALFLVDPESLLITDCNRRAVELFEADSKTELIGIEGRSLQQRPFTEAEIEQITLEMEQKGFWSAEVEYITRKGHHFWGNLAAKPVQIADRTVNLVRVTDISDRHKIDRIKDEFISIVSHELRTPLTAIRGSLGILETGILEQEPETARRMLQVAVNNSERLVRLVNDILDLERLESGKTQLVMERCNAGDLMKQAADAVQPLALQAAITIELNPLPIEIFAAPDAIVQTLTNLLGNAIKFSSENSRIWLTATVKDEKWEPENRVESSSVADPALPSPAILFTVKDEGRGIPAEKLDNIFGRFQQVDVSDSRQKGGTGLGLSICKSIVQQHGGQIWAESEPGLGSTFYFTLPLRQTNHE